ncbi:hypothetical protein JW921_06685 [Candidatus Fermentibacterales bacterium]|nr:hypothetical protein [Candidatus Fermentibacterales bacterium]
MKPALLVLLLLAMGAFAQPQIVNSFDAPDTGVTGLAYAQGSLYAVATSRVVYQLNPSTGAIQSSFSVTPTNPNGLGYAGTLLYVTNDTYYVYKYTVGGTSQGTTTLYCPG